MAIFAKHITLYMKYLFVILIVSGILMQNISKVIILINFHLNREYIAKNLCVQKEVEDNCCQGSCHLKEKLEEQDKKEQTPAVPNFKDKSETQLFYQKLLSLNVNALDLENILLVPYKETKTISFSVSVFHPPKC
jgi:hypothetical protein